MPTLEHDGAHVEGDSDDAAAFQMDVRVNPAQRRMKQYRTECSDARAVVELTVFLPVGQGEQHGIRPGKDALLTLAIDSTAEGRDWRDGT